MLDLKVTWGWCVAFCVLMWLGACGGAPLVVSNPQGQEVQSPITRSPSHPADPLMSLAFGYEEELGEMRATLIHIDEDILNAARDQDVARSGALKMRRESQFRAIREHSSKAIKVYATIARDHRDYRRRDKTLFRLATLLEARANDEGHEVQRGGSASASNEPERILRQQSRRVYRELIKNYPASRYVPPSYLSFGEYYFEQGDMSSALEFYRRVISYEDSDVYCLALYKLAWCHVNLQDDRQAVSNFVRVIQYAEALPEAPRAEKLAQEARRDLIDPFARTFPPNRAWAFFQRVGEGQEREMMERLAQRYADQGQWSEARVAYQVLMAERSESPELCSYQLGAARSVVRASPPDQQVLELRRTVDLMEAFQAGSPPSDLQIACRQSTAQLLLDVAVAWHRESQATRDQATISRALDLYSLTLAHFPDLNQLGLDLVGGSRPPTAQLVTQWEAELRRIHRGTNP